MSNNNVIHGAAYVVNMTKALPAVAYPLGRKMASALKIFGLKAQLTEGK